MLRVHFETFNTFKNLLVFALITFVKTTAVFSQSSVFDVSGIPLKFNSNQRSFKTNPTTSNNSDGKSVGDIAVYSKVVSVSNQDIDCIIKVKSISSGSTITTFDDNSTGSNSSPDSMFCPRADFPTGGGEIEFEFIFIENGTYSNSTQTGTLVKLINASVNIYDIDISTSSSSKQYNKIERVYNYLLGSPTDLVVNYDTANNHGFSNVI